MKKLGKKKTIKRRKGKRKKLYFGPDTDEAILNFKNETFTFN